MPQGFRHATDWCLTPQDAKGNALAGVVARWSGNFLNWATMTRIDVVRKMLYGGYRETDSATSTVLRLALLGTDAHAFAKVLPWH